jgi:phenylacetate-CoA ligase
MPGMTWPALPAPDGSLLLSIQFQLEATQWWAPERLRRAQFRQLALLLDHAYETVPFYRERLGAAGFRAGSGIDDASFAALPRLTRDDVRAHPEHLRSRRIPPAHAPVTPGQTSGSTGTPIRFLATAVTQLFWRAFSLRDLLWHRGDAGLKLAAIRPDRGPRDDRGLVVADWGPAIAPVFASGPAVLLHSANTLERQIEWLMEHEPDYLLTLATNLLELAREMKRRGVRLRRLRQARTYGEALDPGTRAECEALLGVKLVDMYTCQEAGYLALQCPEHAHYHVQAENAIVEILDDDGRPCADGQTGKVVVTALHNYAMPLIRYEIGDCAQAGAPCACGRGLPVIRRVLGRERNLAVAPDGRRYSPSFPAEAWAGIAPLRQIQLVQRTPRHIEVRFAAERALDRTEERRLGAALRQSLGHPYVFTFVRLERIPRAASGKYEDFLCAVA